MTNKLRNICIFMTFVLTFINFTNGGDLFEGSVCQLHTGESGICKNSENCKWLIQNLQQNKMEFEDIRRCSFISVNQEIVCCADEHPTLFEPRNPSPCELGYLFDNSNCSANNANSIEPGTKIKAACQRYMAYAAELSTFSNIDYERALPTEFPHMAALGYLNNKNGYDFDCEASLIADRWLVTAAHCIKDRRKPIMVRMGKVHLLYEDDGLIAIDRHIKRIIRHPGYVNSKKKNDIALIEFGGENVTFSNKVHPACIGTDTRDVAENVELTIAGWGSIEAERTNRSKILLKTYLNVVPLDACNRTLIKYNEFSNQPSLRALSESQMCALNRNTKSDPCQDDINGPLLIRDSNGMSTIIGISSFGISCGTDLPSVLTRIASHIDWIENIVWP